MSHGSSEEPDLTAMLDVVMQLLMYFIMCVKFSADEVPTGTIVLPYSQQAKPAMRREDEEVLYLTLSAQGLVTVFGQPEPMDANGAAFKLWLGNRAMDAKAKAAGGKLDRFYIVLRADRGASYSNVYRLLQEFKKQGFTRFRVRANTGGA